MLRVSVDGNCSQHHQSGSLTQINENECFSHHLLTPKMGGGQKHMHAMLII
jgi:hypothetical protein